MIQAALDWVRSQDRQALCVLIGLGCYALIPFAMYANRTASLNRIADAIKGKDKL